MKLPKLKKYEKITITWMDSCILNSGEWMPESEIDIEDRLIIETTGQYIEHDKHKLIICQGHYESGEIVHGVYEIPVGCIIEVTKHKED